MINSVYIVVEPVCQLDYMAFHQDQGLDPVLRVRKETLLAGKPSRFRSSGAESLRNSCVHVTSSPFVRQGLMLLPMTLMFALPYAIAPLCNISDDGLHTYLVTL